MEASISMIDTGGCTPDLPRWARKGRAVGKNGNKKRKKMKTKDVASCMQKFHCPGFVIFVMNEIVQTNKCLE